METLKQHGRFEPSGPVVVVILDGVGIGRQDEGDAVFLARTPTMDWLDQNALKTTLLAHGTHVGMPSDADMGNSEVGHNALGAGKIYSQGATQVDSAIRSGNLFERGNPDSETWSAMVDHVNEHRSTFHLIGLLSDGNVHSHIDHVVALARNAAKQGVKRLRLHALLDGRDVGGQSAHLYVQTIEDVFSELNDTGTDYRIASGGGRMLVTMDRYEAEWEMVELGWRTHVRGEGPRWKSAMDAIHDARRINPDLNDQYLPAFVIEDANGEPSGPIVDGDAVLLFNFRGDRAIELSRAFEEVTFQPFARGDRPDVFFAGMMQYDGDLGIPKHSLVRPSVISGTMGELLAESGVKQLAVSETQKYGHVTYFWNGNRTEKFIESMETYIEVPSDKVLFEQRPWMKAAEITDATIAALREDRNIRFARVNYPNGDMVGHTGNLDAAVIAVEAADLCLARLLEAIRDLGGVAIVTADHGNSDQMFQLDKNGNVVRNAAGRPEPMTAHTLNPVPFWVWAPSMEGQLVFQPIEIRRLSHVAATALFLMGFETPQHMDPSLVTLAGVT